MSDASAFAFTVGEYLVAHGEGGALRVVHAADPVDTDQAGALVAITSSIPGGQGIALLFDPDEATTVACHICTMAHYLRLAA